MITALYRQDKVKFIGGNWRPLVIGTYGALVRTLTLKRYIDASRQNVFIHASNSKICSLWNKHTGWVNILRNLLKQCCWVRGLGKLPHWLIAGCEFYFIFKWEINIPGWERASVRGTWDLVFGSKSLPLGMPKVPNRGGGARNQKKRGVSAVMAA